MGRFDRREPAGGNPGFWKRQFEQRATRAQKIFDILIGVLLPAACLYFDPVLCTGWPSP